MLVFLIKIWFEIVNISRNIRAIFIKDKISKYTEYLSEIEVVASEIKYHFNGTGVKVGLFHNGDYYNNGKSIQKLSAIYEVADPDVRHAFRDLQNIPLSFYLQPMQIIIRDGIYYIEDSKTAEIPNQTIKAMIDLYKIKSYYLLPIHDKHGRIIGVCDLTYVKGTHVLTESERNYLKYLTERVSTILQK